MAPWAVVLESYPGRDAHLIDPVLRAAFIQSQCKLHHANMSVSSKLKTTVFNDSYNMTMIHSTCYQTQCAKLAYTLTFPISYLDPAVQ